MRAKEFVSENTCAGSVAAVAVPLGSAPIKREGVTKPAKYANSLKRNKNVNR